MTRFTLCLVILAAVTATLCGCNTLKGMGKDIEKAGQAIEGAASK